MKNVILSFFLFFLMVIGILFSLNSMNKMYNELETLNLKLEQSISKEDWHESSKLIEEISEKWDKHSNKLSIIVNHNELDNINSELSKLSQYIKYNDKEESMASLYVIKFFFNHTLDIEKISLRNIF